MHGDVASPSQRGKARPFLKWAGGKQQLLSQYDQLFPARFTRYFEPFLGGAAVFFHLWNRRAFRDQAVLCDSNPELVLVYEVVRDDVESLIEVLREHAQHHSHDYYYRIRNLDRIPDLRLGRVAKAARTIYLNKSCFNGLYRVNRSGHFNVPIGSYVRPPILQEEILRSASVALRETELRVCDFERVLELAGPGDFIYFDPPYDPLSRTASFTSYTKGDFDDEDQRKLASTYRGLDERGCFVMLSNSNTSFVRHLYVGFDIRSVQANRSINSKGDGRGAIQEVAILNYPIP